MPDRDLPPAASIEVTAHRGWSGVEPESTRAAYLAAIELSRRTGRGLMLECDVHQCASGELVIIHDHTTERTGDRVGVVAELTIEELRTIDFGSWLAADPTPDQRALITLPELFDLIVAARNDGVDVGASVEVKRPSTDETGLTLAVIALIRSYGWDGADSPIRVITFDPGLIALVAQELPAIRHSFLVSDFSAHPVLEQYADGSLPPGVNTAGASVSLLRDDPGYPARLAERGHQAHVWTANSTSDIAYCRSLGVTGITSDFPDRVIEALGSGEV